MTYSNHLGNFEKMRIQITVEGGEGVERSLQCQQRGTLEIIKSLLGRWETEAQRRVGPGDLW